MLDRAQAVSDTGSGVCPPEVVMAGVVLIMGTGSGCRACMSQVWEPRFLRSWNNFYFGQNSIFFFFYLFLTFILLFYSFFLNFIFLYFLFFTHSLKESFIFTLSPLLFFSLTTYIYIYLFLPLIFIPN